MIRTAIRLFLASLLFPVMVQAQDLERAAPSGQSYTSPSTLQQEVQEPREFHVTPILIDSEEGREALRLYQQYRSDGYYERDIRLMEMAELEDTRTFFVRNIEESLAGSAVFDTLSFVLARIGSDLGTGGRVEVWVEEDERSPTRISEAILDQILEGLADRTPATSVDPNRGVVEIARSLFGQQPNVDGTGTLKVLIANIQDGWGQDGQTIFTAGFFDPINLLPTSQNPHSNEADIIYINSMPGIYRPGIGQMGSRLNTIAHELQHLIHARYGNLSLFQNEGQSELAEVLSGYSARAMNFLNSPGEVRGDIDGSQRWIYRFRSGSGEEVLYDYQRAQLLHSYLEELIGPEDAGSLTRSTVTRDAAYREVLNRNGISLQDFFTDFWLSAYANRRVADEPFGFSRPQLANVTVSNPGRFYHSSVQPWVRGREETLHYGGALYTEWFGIEELSLTVEPQQGVVHRLLYRRRGETDFNYMKIVGGTPVLLDKGQEIYEQVVMVSVNTTPIGNNATAGESRSFRYSGDWTSTGLVAEELSYHGEAAALTALPQGDIAAYALRISPDFDAAVRTVRFRVYEQEGSVQGDGDLRLALRQARPSSNDSSVLIPGGIIASQPVTMNDLSVGENFFGVNSEQWEVEAGEEYFISLELIEDRGGLLLELMLDNGTTGQTDPADPNYTPVRTLAGLKQGGSITSWRSMQYTDQQSGELRERLNLLMGATLVGFREGPSPDFPEPPINDTFDLVQNFPNPFSTTTTIGFSLPKDADIEITIHDILGRKVDDLHSGQTPAGSHTIHYDPVGLASGIYFYRMAYPGGVKTRRMTLLR